MTVKSDEIPGKYCTAEAVPFALSLQLYTSIHTYYIPAVLYRFKITLFSVNSVSTRAD